MLHHIKSSLRQFAQPLPRNHIFNMSADKDNFEPLSHSVFRLTWFSLNTIRLSVLSATHVETLVAEVHIQQMCSPITSKKPTQNTSCRGLAPSMPASRYTLQQFSAKNCQEPQADASQEQNFDGPRGTPPALQDQNPKITHNDQCSISEIDDKVSCKLAVV